MATYNLPTGTDWNYLQHTKRPHLIKVAEWQNSHHQHALKVYNGVAMISSYHDHAHPSRVYYGIEGDNWLVAIDYDIEGMPTMIEQVR